MHPLHLYVDGGCIGGNPGRAIYWSVGLELDRKGTTKILFRRTIPGGTNNEAEWYAVVEAMEEVWKYFTGQPNTKIYQYWGKPKLGTPVRIHTDSQLVEKQYKEEWKTKYPAFRPLSHRARELATSLGNLGVPLELVWVPRVENVKRLGH